MVQRQCSSNKFEKGAPVNRVLAYRQFQSYPFSQEAVTREHAFQIVVRPMKRCIQDEVKRV